MPRVTAKSAPAKRPPPPRAPQRNPRLIAERPSKSEIRRRQLAKLAGPISVVALLGCVALVGLALSKSANPDGALGRMRAQIGAATGLTIQQVQYLHRNHTPQALLDAALAPDSGAPLIGASILNYPLATARARLLQIPWIADATVERRMPGTLVVDLTEHDAFAIWQNQGRFVLIDRTGKPLPDVDVTKFRQLPLVVGEGAPEAAPAMLDALATQPAIQKLVTAVVRVGDRRWNLYLSNGTEVLLPQDHEPAAIARLGEYEAADKLLERPLAAIDMRQPDKMVIRLRDDPAAPAVTPAKGAT